MKKTLSLCLVCAALIALSACFSSAPNTLNTAVDAPLSDARHAPEPAVALTSPVITKKIANGRDYVAVTANPLATQVASEMLAKGGTAIDAAIAAQWVLGLVEPQSSGLGGGGFLLYWDAAKQTLLSYDGRETAPLAADEQLFIDAESHTPMSFFNAIVGGRSVGVPGLVKMLDVAHQAHGKIAWSELAQPAIVLARNGFDVSPRLQFMLERVPALDVREKLKEYLFPNGKALLNGDRLRNIDYAKSLEAIASRRSEGFYKGNIAQAVVDTVNKDSNAGSLSLLDLANYQVKSRDPVCKVLFEKYKICGMGPPSSGASTIISILAMLDGYALANAQDEHCRFVADCAELAHRYIESSRAAFADRNTYLADPDFIDNPIEGLLEDDYIAARAALISDRRKASYSAGEPAGVRVGDYHTRENIELASTTHLSIVDSFGNAVSMTTSIETAFGSRLMTKGFVLNNQLTDFSFSPVDSELNKLANRVEGGKRPLSSMSPTVVFDENNEPVLVIGSPGGKGIIGFVARVIYEVLVLHTPLGESIAAPHIIDTGNKLRVEPEVSATVLEKLREKGHEPHIMPLSSGVHAIYRIGDGGTNDDWLGVADPRREGSVSAR